MIREWLVPHHSRYTNSVTFHQKMNTVDRLILSQEEFGFFYSPNRNYSRISCKELLEGSFNELYSYEFNNLGQIKTEIGFLSGWEAYPPLRTIPKATYFKREYSYEKNLLRSVKEFDINTSELKRSFEFEHKDEKLIKVKETDETERGELFTTKKFQYNSEGLVIKEIIALEKTSKIQLYSIQKIIRDDKNRIVKLVNTNAAEREGKTITNIISTSEIIYSKTRIEIQFSSAFDEPIYTTSAELVENESKYIKSIKYPKELTNRRIVEFEYDASNENLMKKKITFDDKILVYSYVYE